MTDRQALAALFKVPDLQGTNYTRAVFGRVSLSRVLVHEHILSCS